MTKTNTQSSHDKVAVRLADILFKLNNGEKLDPKELAETFGVTLRTIQRDLLERLAFLPITKDQHYFVMDPFYLGKLTTADIHRFASLSGIKELFPVLTDSFLRELFDTRVSMAYLVKGHRYEDLSDKTTEFKQLEQAIIQQRLVNFIYKGKCYSAIAPYKLVNENGIWYLAATDDGQLKAFCFSKLKTLHESDRTFIPDAEVIKTIENEDSIWYSTTKREVVLKIGHQVATYFKRRALLPNQQIDKELEDGSLIVSTRIAHDDQILPLVKYWIPHVQVISPNELRDSLLQSLGDYLHGNESAQRQGFCQ